MKRTFAAALVLALSAVACSSSSNKDSGGGAGGSAGSGGSGGVAADASDDAFSCGAPNPIGVGATCTAGGNECRTMGANLCSCDFYAASYCACSKMCPGGDGDCGGDG